MSKTIKRLTPAEESIMDEMYWAGHIDRELDAATGRAMGTAAHWRYRLGYPPNGIPGGITKEYAVYSKTDELLALGNAEECVRAMGLANVKSFYSIVSRVRRGLNKKYSIVKLPREDA